MIDYKTMTIEDYDGVYALWASTPEMGINSRDDSREGIEKYLRRNPGTSFVALDGERVVGAILAGHDGRRGYIQHMTVLEGYRRQGIGTALLKRSMAALEEEGLSKVALVAFRKNERANAFWEAEGFTVREDLVYRNSTLRELSYRPNTFRDE